MVIPKRLLVIVVVVVVVAWLLFTFVGPLLAPKPLRVYVTATLADGRVVTVADSSAGPLGSIVTYNGQVVTAFHFYTTFQGTSQGYTQYTLTSNDVGTFKMVIGSTRCQQMSLSAQVTRSPPSPFNMGTTYNLGDYATSGSGSPPSVLDVASSSIVGWSTTCAGDASYNLVYTISLTAQAVGVGTLPTSTWTGTITLGIVVAPGTMTLTGSNTSTVST